MHRDRFKLRLALMFAFRSTVFFMFAKRFEKKSSHISAFENGIEKNWHKLKQMQLQPLTTELKFDLKNIRKIFVVCRRTYKTKHHYRIFFISLLPMRMSNWIRIKKELKKRNKNRQMLFKRCPPIELLTK